MIGQTISHYKILEKIGEGGMGVVYKARDTKLDRDVALKFLPHHITINEADKARFLQEARAAAALNHPNIATIHAIEETDGELFIAMECIKGTELKEFISNSTPETFSINDVIAYALQISKGLVAAHNAGIIHRDIKSSNIMVTESGLIKIMDFGLAKMGDGKDLTKDHSTVGTLAFMAPEQIQGQPVDNRADIFSYGVVLFEMLTGKLPFRGDYESAMMYSILNEEPEYVKDLRSDCPDSLDKIISKCLQKDPHERFQNMGEIFEGLKDGPYQTTFNTVKSENHNLPIQLTSFIGRGKEIKAVKDLLRENRLVTLTGTGGCGKTRLAIEVALEIFHDYGDGVWLVELAPISDPKQIAASIAQVFQIKEELNSPLMETIIKQLKDKQLLLILDNCEHLIDSCADTTKNFLGNIKGITILATSREAFNTSGELAWRIPSLSLPQTDHLEGDEAIYYEAIKLFEERAKGNQPQFAINSDNANIIAKICQRLDGIPLAIELAAARIKMLNPDQILSRLSNRFQLLTGGDRTALERQKTLRATVDWSYELLNDQEQTVFNRLTVFVNGCDLEAAEAVCGDDKVSTDDVLDLLSSLIDKSLVISEAQSNSTYRYRLLETLRHYAGEKLLQHNEADLIRERHYSYYSSLAERAYDERIDNPALWLEKLKIDRDNIDASLKWVEQDHERYLQLAGALGWFWHTQSYLINGRKLLTSALKGTEQKSANFARALDGLGRISTYLWDIEGGLGNMEKAAQMFEELGLESEAANCMQELGYYFAALQFNEKAIRYAYGAVNQAEKTGNQKKIASAKIFLCTTLTFVESKIDETEGIIHKYLPLVQKFKMPREIMWCKHNYGDITLIREEYEKAVRRYGEAMNACLALGDIFQANADLYLAACSYSGLKRYDKALILTGAVKATLEELGVPAYAPCLDFLIEKHIDGAIRQVGEEKAFILEKKGREMGFNKAVDYALDFDRD